MSRNWYYNYYDGIEEPSAEEIAEKRRRKERKDLFVALLLLPIVVLTIVALIGIIGISFYAATKGTVSLVLSGHLLAAAFNFCISCSMGLTALMPIIKLFC